MLRIILHLCLFLKHQPDVFRLLFLQDSTCSKFQVVCKIFDGFFVVHVTTIFNFKDKLIPFDGNADGNRCLCRI